MSKWTAYDLFGPMRSSTLQEQELYNKMIEKYSISIEKGMYCMSGDIEKGTCDICGEYKQLSRKYYYYPVNCECCGGERHFEIVRYCKNCTPVPPRRIKAIMKPVTER